MSLVSIIIPTFNRRNLVMKAIDSALLQTYKHIEIIVIDDGSQDGSLAYLKANYSFDERVNILSQKHQGVSAARNYGITQSKGDWIAFLDSDDLWSEDKIRKQIDYLNHHLGYKICYNDEIWIRNSVRVNPPLKCRKVGGKIFKESVDLCLIAASAVMIHKSIFDELGNFDESMPACEDYDLWLRITAKYPILFLDELLTTRFGGHDDQLSAKYLAMDRFRVYALAKILHDSSCTKEQKDLVLPALRAKVKLLLKGARKHDNQELLEILNDKYIGYM